MKRADEKADTNASKSDLTPSRETWEGLQALSEILQERTRQYVNDLYARQNHLEENVGMLTAILHSMGEAMIVVDAEGKVVLCNAAAEALTSLKLYGMTQAQWAAMSKSYEPGSMEPIPFQELPASKARQGQACTKTMLIVTEQAPEGRWIRVNSCPVNDAAGQFRGAVSIIQDLTESRRLTQQRDALSALVTHDLKNHISGESELLKMILDGTFGEVPAEVRRTLEVLQSQSNRQLQMLTSLIEIYRYEVGSESLRFEPTDISKEIQSAIEEVLPSVELGSLKLKSAFSADLALINADARALRHVFLNLLGNAIKFTPPNGEISIAARMENGRVLVTVSDSGKGVPEDELRILFEDAWSLSTAHKPFGSTGMGLYLCRRLLDSHAATIKCESQKDSGTTFSISFPGIKAV